MKWLNNLLRRNENRPTPVPPAPVLVPAVEPVPGAGESPDAWADALCRATDQSRALAWLAELKDETALARVACEARLGEVRHEAARRLHDDTLLERVAQASRGKDKRVHRHCADLLRQRRQAADCTARASELAGELRTLLGQAPLPLSRLMEIKELLAALPGAGESGTRAQALLDQAFAQVRGETEARRDLQVHLETAAALAGECAGPTWPWLDRLAGWQDRLADLTARRSDLAPWLVEQAAARALDEHLAGIAGRLARLAEDGSRAGACAAFLAALPEGAGGDPATRQAWQDLAKPGPGPARDELEARWRALQPVLPPPPEPVPEAQAAAKPKRKPAPEFDKAAYSQALDVLEQAIEAGHLADADAAAKALPARPAEVRLPAALAQRQAQLHARHEQLRGWARWGGNQARDQLVAAAQALLAGAAEPDVNALAKSIGDLRAEWKRLDAHAGAARAQWEAFDAALEQAWQPVAQAKAEAAERQAQARAVREGWLDGWEAEQAALDWSQADGKDLDARRAALIQQWRGEPKVGFKDERELRKRFDLLIEALDRHLQGLRGAETVRRQELIAAAQALAGEADLRRAMKEARQLQERWKQAAAPVRLKRGEEQSLWQAFRAACDAVFGRLDAVKAEEAARRQMQIAARLALLDEFAARLESGPEEGLSQDLARFRKAWEGGRPEGDDPLASRAEAVVAQARRKLSVLEAGQRRARQAALLGKAALAGELEAAAVNEPANLPAVRERVQAAWAALPALPGEQESALARRVADAGRLDRDTWEAGQRTRAALLLDLEIALELPTPATWAEARRARQLERLQHRFAGQGPADATPERLLLQCLATAAPADPALDARLAAALERLGLGAGSGQSAP